MGQREWTIEGQHTALVVHEWPTREVERIVIISHGYGEHMRRYSHVARVLNESGILVVGADHMGHGLSGGARVSVHDLDDLAHDLHRVVALVRGLHPEVPTTIIGHSLGGLIATRHMQLYPGSVTQLILSSPVLGHWRTTEQLLQMSELPTVPLRSMYLSHDSAAAQAYESDPLVWHGGFERHTLEAIATAIERANSGVRIEDMSTLWLHGTADRLVPIEGTARGITKIFGESMTQHHFKNGRHELFNEINRDEVIACVSDFVTAV